MAIAARYINRELLAVFLVVALVLLVVALGGRFIGYLQEAALGKYSGDGLLTIVWLRLPEFLQQLAPFAFYLGLLLAFGRLPADHEIPVLQSGGVGPYRLLGWVLPATLLVAAGVGYLALMVTPQSTVELDQFILSEADRQEFNGVTPGIFRTIGASKRVTYTETVSSDRQRLGNVFIAEPNASRPITVWAEKGSQYVDDATGSVFLLLENGTRYEGEIGSEDYRKVSFGALGQRLLVSDTKLVRIDPDSTATAVLWRDGGLDNLAELQWRVALPLLVLIGTGLAVGMSRVRSRQGRFTRVVPGLLVFVAYYLLLVILKDLVAEGAWPVAVGLWPVHGVFLLVAAALLRRISLPAPA